MNFYRVLLLIHMENAQEGIEGISQKYEGKQHKNEKRNNVLKREREKN